MTLTPVATANELLRRYVARRDPAVLGDLFVATARHLLRAALRVTRDRVLAEDALQESFLAIFQGRARFDSRREALPWLRAVVAQKARQALRRRAVRCRGEVVGGDGDFVAAPPPALAGDERERLLRAIGELPPAYRIVVERRFLRGDCAPTIARDLALANASVRSRLQRGLQLLRQSLRSLLAVLFALLTGRHGHGAQGVLVAGALTVLLALVGWWAAAPHGSQVTSTVVEADRMAAVARPAVAQARAREAATIRQPAAAVAVVAAAPLVHALRLQFADGAPAAHVGLRWTLPGEDFALGVRRLHSDADGRVAVPGDVALPLEVRTDRGPVVTLAASATPVIVPVVGPASTVRVSDASGRPVAAVAIWLGDSPGAFDGAIIGATDADGRLTLRALPVGSHVAAIAADGRTSPLACVRDGSDLPLQLATPGRRILGRVVDADGEPLAAARVGRPGGSALQPVLPGNLALAGAPALVVETAVDGTFALPIGDADERLLVQARGHVPTVLDVPAGPEPFVVRLVRAPRLLGRVTDRDGRPLGDAAVRVCGAAWFARSGAFTAANGEFVFDALPPGPTEVEIALGGHDAVRRTIELPASGEIRCVDVLVPRSIVRLRVQDGDGGAVAGVEAGAMQAGGPPRWVSRSDARGALAVELPDGPFGELLARRGRHSPWVALSVHDVADGTVDAARLGSARVLVEVVDAAGQPVPLLGIACRDALGSSLLPVTRRGDRWATGFLPPGDCELRLLPGSSQVAATTVRVAGLLAGEHRDLGIVPLPSPVPCRIDVVGEDLRGEESLFVLRDEHGDVLTTAVGSAAVALTAPVGEHRLAVFGERTEWCMDRPVAFAAATAVHTVALRRGRRRVVVLDAALEAVGDAVVTIERVDAGPARCVYVDRRRGGAGASLRLEPVLGEGTFALTVRTAGAAVGVARATFVVGADSECLTVPLPQLRVMDRAMVPRPFAGADGRAANDPAQRR